MVDDTGTEIFMAYKIEGEVCPVCKAYLFDDDDVVFCPICGAPHHRDCYASVGHCGLEELHGTANEYRPKTDDGQAEEPKKRTRCLNCGREVLDDTRYCPYCGTDISSGQRRQSNPMFAFQIDPYGGIPNDGSVTVDGGTPGEICDFIQVNTARYIPVFAAQDEKNKRSWNWASFLVPAQWAMFRKNYKLGLIAAAVMLIGSILTIPFSVELVNIISAMETVNTNAAQLGQILTALPKVSLFADLTFIAGSLLRLATMIFFGFMGDWFYRDHVTSTIKEIKSGDYEDVGEAIRHAGGVSFLWFAVTWLALSSIPDIITALL